MSNHHVAHVECTQDDEAIGCNLQHISLAIGLASWQVGHVTSRQL